MSSKSNDAPVRGDAPANNLSQPAETHQSVEALADTITTNHGIPIADNQNTLLAGVRGPALMEDFVLREKLTHFDHERIPERVVHARGSGAHGYFELYASLADITKAAFLSDPAVRTDVFARFSTVAGSSGSGDLARDVRGFAVKFYTSEGIYDLVGNNIPVFFVQDAMKFPDLAHAVKPEPDRGFPQASSAHDTFWDFVSLSPESMHMLLWTMSDRAIPRSFRMIEGFGVNTFRMVNAAGASNFVKFHWRPRLGLQSVLWDEAVSINGADPDFHRRDLWEAIDQGDFPEWEFGVQVISEATAASLDFDVLDPTKLIPEELVPVRIVGKMVLNRNVGNFFSETEQVAFLPTNLPPGIEFSNDPLLQGRLHSYQDTQITRLGGPNFHELPINAARCPMHNFQRDGMHQMNVPKGRVSYEPNSLDQGVPRENPHRGATSIPEQMDGEKIRQRASTFADHYSQARLFFRSVTKPEQAHIIDAFAFELSKVQVKAIRTRMLGHLAIIDPDLQAQVEASLGMQGEADTITPAVKPRELTPSPALSILAKAVPTLKGRKVGVLLLDGFDPALLTALQDSVNSEKASLFLVANSIAGATDSSGKLVPADGALSGSPSVFFDSVAILAPKDPPKTLPLAAATTEWLEKAFNHRKVMAYSSGAKTILERAQVASDPGVVLLSGASSVGGYIKAAKHGRLWDRVRAGEEGADA
ncbi:catalase [Cyanobium gracile]|uniref:Catalase n=1 Tax=Cyanobium gracile (strain ATCC 27147 / PCC 6307) TaxID=292564 RepID=K9P4E9_CYAGP|nr:catalase [Cyanobium gracile]AFY27975.1 catalase [Cyanobium gracile PCC 6307]